MRRIFSPGFICLVVAGSMLACSPGPSAIDAGEAVMPEDGGGSVPDAGLDPSSPATAAVSTYHREATETAEQILKRGGNAFDAFIAATFVQYVIAPGVTSAAGPLTALIYDSKKSEVWHLDGEFNAPLQAPSDPAGRGILVPGAIAALAELSAKHGRLPLSELVEPARKLAEEGFIIDAAYAGAIHWRSGLLSATEYGRTTFFHNGQPLAAGHRLRQPELASFLASIGADGADYVYRGAWAQRFVTTAQSAGSRITAEDLNRYQAQWRVPAKITYEGAEVYAPSGRTFGGLWCLLALEVLEQAQLKWEEHDSRSVDVLEVLLRVARAVHEEPWFYDLNTLDQPSAIEQKLGEANTRAIWEKVKAKLSEPARSIAGQHSYSLTIVDQEGNAITGTHTITSLPWGNGLFVEGVPLTAGGELAYPRRPGERWASAISMHLAVEQGRLRSASATFSTSLLEAELQLLVNVLNHRMSAGDATAAPRFGTFPFDLATMTPDLTKNWLDPAFGTGVADELGRRGLSVEQSGSWVDTGLGTAVVIDEAGRKTAGFSPRSDLGGSAKVF